MALRSVSSFFFHERFSYDRSVLLSLFFPVNVVLNDQLNSVLPPQLAEIGAQYGIPIDITNAIALGVLGGPTSHTLAPFEQYIPPGSPQYDAVVDAIRYATSNAFRLVFIAIGCVTAIPVVLSIFLKKPNLQGGTLAVLEGEEKKADEEEVDLSKIGEGTEVEVTTGLKDLEEVKEGKEVVKQETFDRSDLETDHSER